MLAASESLLKCLSFIVVILVVHELGHYAVARWRGVRVRAVSLGFGRELVGWTDGHGTRWKLSVLPIGGYVQMADLVASPGPSNHGFDQRPLTTRVGIMAAGPAANFVLTLLILAVLFLTVGERVSTSEVTDILPGGPAARAGMRVGDRIESIAGMPVGGFDDVHDALNGRGGMPTVIELVRDGQRVTVDVVPAVVEIRRRIGSPRHEIRIGIWHKRWPGTAWDSVVRFRSVMHAQAIGLAVDRTGRLIGKPFGLAWRKLNDIHSDNPLAAMKPPRLVWEDENGADTIATMGEFGIVDASYFIAYGSVTFGLINLLPFPPMDGWHIGSEVVAAIQALRRRRRRG